MQSQVSPSGGDNNGIVMNMVMMLIQNQQAEIRELKESVHSIVNKQQQTSTLDSIWSANDRIRIKANLDTNPLKSEIQLKPAFKGGKPSEYLSGATVIDHMNQVFGFNGWNTEYFQEDKNIIGRPDENGGNFRVSVTVNCKVVLIDGSFHVDTGTGIGQMGDLHQAMDTAKKSAYTDSMKRACRKFGKYLGLALYVSGSARSTAYSNQAERDQVVEAKAQQGRDILAVSEQQQNAMDTARPSSSGGLGGWGWEEMRTGVGE
ncbi:hypothetical protein TL16_g07413 [Triparma laevis f. inornata]|uniref:Uncharacterized protein n=1 Tax=Triparma laevis f. inornata TaxID=1714386 RepID=A0A9W7EGU0_9STRA|nr:hypothetical protein TL16_g07413 [Triparma laevis f. inornata]